LHRLDAGGTLTDSRRTSVTGATIRLETLEDLIRASIWAAALAPDQLERVRAETVLRPYAAGTLVCRRGERAESWVGVLQGLLKLSSDTPDGRTVTFAGVPAGAWFGEGSLLKAEERKYDAVALRESRVALMPRATFSWLLDTSIGFNRFLLEQLNERLGQFIGLVEHRLLTPEARIARSLATLFNRQLYPGVERSFKLSQEEIGYLSGVSRQRANQALRMLEQEGLLELGYGGVTVIDAEGLRRYEG
jgi:CRP-like cAMP-binding protein